MAFTYDATTSRGRVRLLLSDTDTANATKQIFTDAEIDALLDLASQEIFDAAAMGCRSIAASASRSAVAYRAVGMTIQRNEIPKHFLELAKQYEGRVASELTEFVDSFDDDIGPYGTDRSEYTGETW